LLLLHTIVVVILTTVCNSFYIVCTFVLIRPIIVLFSYSALGCKSVLINQSIGPMVSMAYFVTEMYLTHA